VTVLLELRAGIPLEFISVSRLAGAYNIRVLRRESQFGVQLEEVGVNSRCRELLRSCQEFNSCRFVPLRRKSFAGRKGFFGRWETHNDSLRLRVFVVDRGRLYHEGAKRRRIDQVLLTLTFWATSSRWLKRKRFF